LLSPPSFGDNAIVDKQDSPLSLEEDWCCFVPEEEEKKGRFGDVTNILVTHTFRDSHPPPATPVLALLVTQITTTQHGIGPNTHTKIKND
jgi:hypothetical protein